MRPREHDMTFEQDTCEALIVESDAQQAVSGVVGTGRVRTAMEPVFSDEPEPIKVSHAEFRRLVNILDDEDDGPSVALLELAKLAR